MRYCGCHAIMTGQSARRVSYAFDFLASLGWRRVEATVFFNRIFQQYRAKKFTESPARPEDSVINLTMK